MDCLFCQIINKEIPSYTIHEDEFNISILDIRSINHGHVLVIPKMHFERFSEMDEMNGIELFRTLHKIEKVVAESGCAGTNILQNNGRYAGQDIPHVHFHIIPRFTNDTFRFKYQKIPVTVANLEYSMNYYSKKLIE